MYEELIDRLLEGADFLEMGTPGVPHNSVANMCRNAADAIDELQAVCKKQEIDLVELTGVVASKATWISVEERLPERNEKVVVSDGQHTWDCGAFQGIGFSDGNRTKWNWKHNTVKTVLWWMPKKDALPMPPKEEQK